MSRIRLLRFCVLGSALLGLNSSARASQNDARVENIGAAPATRHNRLLPWRPVGNSGRIPEVVQVRCKSACTIRANDDVSVELEPGAIVALRDHFFIPLTPYAPMTRARQVELVEGRITAISADRPGAMPVVVLHEGAYVAIQRGRAEIAVRGNNVLAAVNETNGRVAVRRGWSTLEPNHSIILTRQGPSKPKLRLSQPQWDVDNASCAQPLTLVEATGKGSVGACWKPVERAHSYVVEIASDPEFANIEQVVETTEFSWSSEREIGRWYVRVRAVDADGFRSDVSEPRAFGVVPVRMPVGSLLDATHRALVLPDATQVEFEDTARLQVAIDKGAFMQLPSVIRVAGETERTLRLRYEGERYDSSVFSLQRRQLRADIQLTPRIARWPSDPIDILVRVEDPSGFWNLSSVQPKLQVLVGMTETKVEWARSGFTWAARLAPRDMAGPTVVRVIALDEFGLQLGRNFLEVDYSRRPRPAVGRGSEPVPQTASVALR